MISKTFNTMSTITVLAFILTFDFTVTEFFYTYLFNIKVSNTIWYSFFGIHVCSICLLVKHNVEIEK